MLGSLTVLERSNIKEKFGVNYLLSPDSYKIDKSNNFGDASYYTEIHYGAPASLSGHNACPFSSAGCREMCLNTAGRGGMNMVQLARLRRTRMFYSTRLSGEYMQLLYHDIHKMLRKADRLERKPAIRLNGTTDFPWEKMRPELFTDFPQITYYEYTKYPLNKREDIPSNLDLTFSRSEENEVEAFHNLEHGRRVAVVFRGPELPTTWRGYPVVDGDRHDMRFLDPQGVIVGLTAKGKAKHDTSGFVVDA